MKIPRLQPASVRAMMLVALLVAAQRAAATPANKAALEKHFDRFLARPLAHCNTCHLPSESKFPQSLGEFPHNPFGDRLRKLGEDWSAAGRRKDIPARIAAIAADDSDGDGVANETELLLGHNPGNPKDTPSGAELASAADRKSEYIKFLGSYRWQPFEPVRRPPLPAKAAGFSNPIDGFLEAERAAHGLKARGEASREVLLRRVYQDLIGLNPTPAELAAFLADKTQDAYEKVVDRLLADPRHGERWGRHWMDVWRYSDWAGWTDGGQVRDSKPHIWRWRDWIVESLNADLPYDAMIVDMLAADEATPGDDDALRATGFLVRNYKMLSREQWLEDTIKHTGQAFLGVTIGCAKCHDHMMDPISQREYYALRAVFEPHQVRTERLPGELDTGKTGLVRAYDAGDAPTWIFARGDERHPLTNEVIQPAVPAVFGGTLDIRPVTLPWSVSNPDQREFVVRDTVDASAKTLADARAALVSAQTATNRTDGKIRLAEGALNAAEKRHAALLAVLEAERPLRESRNRSATNTGVLQASSRATNAVLLQRTAAVAEAALKRDQAAAAVESSPTNKVADARKKLDEAQKQWQAAVDTLARPLDGAFTPRPSEVLPASSTGRRLAFARWVASPGNPLTARVAANHVWLRHFGRGLVPTPSDFGRNGRPATHPQLLDWLAAEFMEPTTGAPAERKPWSFRHLHRLIVTSAAYRMASTSDPADLAADPDNQYLWRMNSRRLEAESVRDNLLYAAGSLDLTRGGPDIDHQLALTSRRRSLYLRHAAEKQAEFLQIFDGPSVTECYQRRPSVMPQQALALGNSDLAVKQAATLARRIAAETESDDRRFIDLAFATILARTATETERRECLTFLQGPLPAGADAAAQVRRRAQENLVLVLFNHNDFVTVR